MRIAFTCVLLPIIALPNHGFSQGVPEGFVLLSDSETAFSGVQGSGGWSYRFDRGEGTASVTMAHFLNGNMWCATPIYGGAGQGIDRSYCVLTAGWGHANSAGACNTPGPGTLRPIRAWTPPLPMRVRIRLSITPEPASSGMSFSLRCDGVPAWSRTWSFGNPPPADEWIEMHLSSSLALIVDPLGSCHGDGGFQRLRIYAADCNGNGVADAIEIAEGLDDSDSDGIPDDCQAATCTDADFFRDFNVNGADLGILLSQWGPNTSLTVADLNRDGVVDGADLGIFLGFWGPCPQ